MTGHFPEWGLCATVKAPVDQVLAYAAHHLSLGAARIWLHFDDPDDPAVEAVSGIPQITPVRCTDAYWQSLVGRRPDRHQNRQARNMQRVYATGALPWVGHLDVDEFLWPMRPVGEVLAALPADRALLRLAPWEALHDPGLPDDIFTARHFRAALRGAEAAVARVRVFGAHAPLLPSGVLSHANGKCFFRSGIKGLEPRLHGAFLGKERLPGGPFTPDVALLHFHAEDPRRWKDRLQFRLTRGAYQYNPPLQDWLLAATPGQIDGFFDAVQTVSPDHLDRLAAEGILLTADLGLRAAVSRLTG